MAKRRRELHIKAPDLWYIVGVITTDGCLSSDNRHIDITSKDKQLLVDIRKALGVSNKIGKKYGIHGHSAFRIQVGNRHLYEFLLSIGLKQKKSLVLDKLAVPCQYAREFVRGIIDGDGCIRRWVHPSNHKEQWSIRIYSGSPKFLLWLQSFIEDELEVCGRIHCETKTKRILKYRKMPARAISRQCYYKGCLCLGRKSRLAKACSTSYQGWNRSATVN